MSRIRSVFVVLSSSSSDENSAELCAELCKKYIQDCQKYDITVDFVDLDNEPEFQPLNPNFENKTKITEYQLRIKRSDKIVIFHPTIFYHLPGGLKLWLDEVFISGFAYRKNRGFLSPLLKHKPLEIFITSDLPRWRIEFLENSGLFRFWKRTFSSTTGMKSSFMFFGKTRTLNDTQKEQILNTIEQKALLNNPDFKSNQIEIF